MIQSVMSSTKTKKNLCRRVKFRLEAVEVMPMAEEEEQGGGHLQDEEEEELGIVKEEGEEGHPQS